MAWTAPMTFSANTALTAAQLNTYLRDNLMETMTAKATYPGAMFFAAEDNSFVERFTDTERINAIESTASTSFTNLDTVGPVATCDTGTSAIVMLAGHVGNNTTSAYSTMGYAVSGASSIAAFDMIAVDGIASATGSNVLGMCGVDLVTTLSPGTNIFTTQYKVGSGTGVFSNRFIAVWPL